MHFNLNVFKIFVFLKFYYLLFFQFLPSPEKLRRRIVLKHKKLPEGSAAEEVTFTRVVEPGGQDLNIANSVHSGILYLQVQSTRLSRVFEYSGFSVNCYSVIRLIGIHFCEQK